jgi:hypothetical protein
MMMICERIEARDDSQADHITAHFRAVPGRESLAPMLAPFATVLR